MPIIETEIWKPNPDLPETVVFDKHREAQDIFDELKSHLIADGRLPDEYFLFSKREWSDGEVFPKDAEILCNVNYGGSEGIYLDIAVKYARDAREHNSHTGKLETVSRVAFKPFATGKTLGDTIYDLDKMHLAASSVVTAFYGSKREIEGRYSKIEKGEEQRIYPSAPEIREPEKSNNHDDSINTKAGEPEIKVGDIVFSVHDSEYGYLAGRVIEIVPLGSENHDTGNASDDIHVDFFAPYSIRYSEIRKAEIAQEFSELYGVAKKYDDLPLDDVIMPPESLIKLNPIHMDLLNHILASRKDAEWCYNEYFSDLRNELFDKFLKRVDQNLTDFQKTLIGKNQREVIDMADKAYAMTYAHKYLTEEHVFDVNYLDFYIKFKEPLKIVADWWLGSHEDFQEISYTMGNIFESKDMIHDDYALADKTGTYTEVQNQPAKAEQPTAKPKTLADKMKAANEKVMAQEGKMKPKKHEER
jgi:hypothetical protein